MKSAQPSRRGIGDCWARERTCIAQCEDDVTVGTFYRMGAVHGVDDRDWFKGLFCNSIGSVMIDAVNSTVAAVHWWRYRWCLMVAWAGRWHGRWRTWWIYTKVSVAGRGANVLCRRGSRHRCTSLRHNETSCNSHRGHTDCWSSSRQGSGAPPPGTSVIPRVPLEPRISGLCNVRSGKVRGPSR